MKNFWHLKTEDFFKDLEAEKEAFLAVASRHRMKKNETVFLEGEEGITCFYIESGLVRIFSSSDAGKELTLFLRRKGEIFGLAELMNDNMPRLASAQALKTSVIYTIEKNPFEQLLREHFSLVRRVINTLGKRLRYIGKRFSSQSSDVRHRLAFVLLTLAYDSLQKKEDWEQPCCLPMPVSQQQLAAMIGSTQPTVSATLQEFKRNNLLEISGRHIRIPNPMLFMQSLDSSLYYS